MAVDGHSVTKTRIAQKLELRVMLPVSGGMKQNTLNYNLYQATIYTI